MERDTKTIRISIDLYNRITELCKKNEDYADAVDRLLRENKLQAIVTET